MGIDYVLVHAYFTIPVALILLLLIYPLRRITDKYRLLFLVLTAIFFTIPWDSYLLKRGIWSYPVESVLGPTVFKIPLEELFFFFIQTLITSTLYLLLSRSVLMEEHLLAITEDNGTTHVVISRIGSILIFTLIPLGLFMVYQQNKTTYLGFVFMWSSPVLLFLWSTASRFILSLPARNVILPIAISSVYLWLVDEMALQKGTWILNTRFTLNVKLFGALDVEEAIFFFLTNTMVTFGQIACDQALAIVHISAEFEQLERSGTLSSGKLMKLLEVACFPERYCDRDYIQYIQMASRVLRRKSRSFTAASMLFEGRLRVDLLLLYYCCRIADDVVDSDSSPKEVEIYLSEVEQWVKNVAKMNKNLSYEKDISHPRIRDRYAEECNTSEPLENTRLALTRLPISCCLPIPTLLNLLDGFTMDLGFSSTPKRQEEATPSTPSKSHDRGNLPTNPCILSHGCKHYSQSRESWDINVFPIREECCLELYGYRVAGTVAELVLSLVFHHYENSNHKPSTAWKAVIYAGARMGIALQYVNIARDVVRDSSDGRVYLPTSWLAELGISSNDILENPYREEVRILRLRLLNMANKIYSENVGAIDEIPMALGWNETFNHFKMVGVRHGMRAAVENYMEIGRVVQRELEFGSCSILRDSKSEKRPRLKATVPKWRRIWVTVKVLLSR